MGINMGNLVGKPQLTRANFCCANFSRWRSVTAHPRVRYVFLFVTPRMETRALNMLGKYADHWALSSAQGLLLNVDQYIYLNHYLSPSSILLSPLVG